MTLAERLAINTEINPITGCWLWTAGIQPNGYAEVQFHGRRGRVHRASYECYIGPIPEGMDLDHTCHDPTICPGGFACIHRRCLNPAHLEPVTRSVNVLRGAVSKNHHWNCGQNVTHCPQGHPYSPVNTMISDGARVCRVCKSARAKIHYAMNREAIKAKVKAFQRANAESVNAAHRARYQRKKAERII